MKHKVVFKLLPDGEDLAYNPDWVEMPFLPRVGEEVEVMQAGSGDALRCRVETVVHPLRQWGEHGTVDVGPTEVYLLPLSDPSTRRGWPRR